LKRIGTTVREYVESLGFELNKAGRGMNFTYDDGEKVYSYWEYIFSNFIREKGLKFSLDYNRSVRYSTFINSYSGYSDCDYEINVAGKTVYVEIAGMLRDYKDWYYSDSKINSLSVDEYRKKLKSKEEILSGNGINYSIIFPCDIEGGLEHWWRSIC
jgi:hypothetical protein